MDQACKCPPLNNQATNLIVPIDLNLSALYFEPMSVDLFLQRSVTWHFVKVLNCLKTALCACKITERVFLSASCSDFHNKIEDVIFNLFPFSSEKIWGILVPNYDSYLSSFLINCVPSCNFFLIFFHKKQLHIFSWVIFLFWNKVEMQRIIFGQNLILKPIHALMCFATRQIKKTSSLLIISRN